MSRQLYAIRPLKWEATLNGISETYRAGTGFGQYEVKRDREGWNEKLPWGPWRWGYCFYEYYDEENFECDSLEEGQGLAAENWMNRILVELEPDSSYDTKSKR